MNMDNASQVASEGDSGHVLDRNSQKIAELEKLVKRLRNALVSLEEDNLNLNRKLKQQRELSSPDPSFVAKSASWNPPTQDEVCLDRYSRLEAEKLKVEARLRRMESKNKVLEAELKRLAGGYSDVMAVNNSPEVNSQLVKKNEILTERMELCRNDQQSSEVEEPNLEKQKLAERVVQLQDEVTHLTEEPQKVQPPSLEDGDSGEREATGGGREPDVASLLRRENRALRESLEQSWLALKRAEGGAVGMREEREELERCLTALRMEKDLLREEMRKLHREYIGLVDSVASRLGDTTPTGGTSVPELATEQNKSGGKEILVTQRRLGRSLHHSHPQRATVDKPLEEMPEQIKVCFEEV